MKILRLLFTGLLLGACASAGTATSTAANGITFIHLNDTYRVSAVEDGTRGGFGRVTTVIRQALAEGRDVRLTHGGDFLYPSLESQLWGGEQMVEAFNFMNRLAPMLAVPGNHEFDPRSPATLVAALHSAEFVWLGDNLAFGTGDAAADRKLKRRYVTDVGGRRVGFFALALLPEDGGYERDYLDYASGYVEQASRALADLQEAGAELIVGITHLHIDDDLDIARLKAKYPRFLFIVGGHEHEPEHHPATVNRAEVMKGASNARQVWRIDVDFGDSGEPVMTSRMLDLDEGVAEDPEYQPIADRWRARLIDTMPFLPAKIGEAAVRLDGREVTVRNEESNLGNFIVDQMRTAFGSPPADLALINSGTLRIDDYIAGDITFEDLARVFAFSSYLRYLDMSGREFRETIEAGYRGTGPSKGYFPQVSGFRVCVDRSRPDGERVAQLQVPLGDGWAEIEPDRLYSVVAPDFILRGGDGYRFPENRPRSKPGSELKYLVLDAILRAQAEGQAVGSPVDPAKPRIALAAEPGGRCFD